MGKKSERVMFGCAFPLLEIVFLLIQTSVNSLWLIAYYINSDISLNTCTFGARGNIFEIISRIAWLPTCPHLLNILFLVSAQMLSISKRKFSRVNTRSIFDLLLSTFSSLPFFFFWIACSRILCNSMYPNDLNLLFLISFSKL